MVEDPYLWLEDVTADSSLAWARERNAVSERELTAEPSFAASRDRARAILDSKDKLPHVNKRASFYYNFWTDEKNPRGLVRRTTFAEYKKPAPSWETVLDIDALSARENESWVFSAQTCLHPKHDRCMVMLSRGGGDATVVREFDAVAKKFVEGGFTLPEAKSNVSWKDRDTLYVSTDFGPGTLTSSGYPRIVKEWKRGTPLGAATVVYEGGANDIVVTASRSWNHGHSYDVITRYITTFTAENFLREASGALVKIDIPADAELRLWNDQLMVQLRSDWDVGGAKWPRGSLIVAPLRGYLDGRREFTALFTPTPNRSLAEITELKTAVVINVLEDVRNKLLVWAFKSGRWTQQPFTAASGKELDSVELRAVDSTGASDEYWMTSSGFLTPTTLSHGQLGKPATALKRSPAFFDTKGLVVSQHFATSRDGTRIPYFQVSREQLALDGSHPTLLYGYGGFEISLQASYSPLAGSLWQERGGVYVIANIRGGGEYGPAWHQAALTHNRQRAYDDFIAVAEDLIARKVTSPAHLGIQGGSNGGLLMGVMLTQRPELFGAVVCSVPLLDMKRYHKLLAGASWMSEYGDPEKPDDWTVLATYSPYQNVRKATKYPRTLFTTSTRDDRVHPAHARKMVARMIEQGHNVLYYENIEGGHGGAATNEQRAHLVALEYTFLARQLGLK